MQTARESIERIVGSIYLNPNVQSVSVAGSVATRLDDEVSDLDLWVVTDSWSPDYLAGLLIAGTTTTVGPGPLFHGVDHLGVMVDIRFGLEVPPEYVPLPKSEAQPFPPGRIEYDNLFVDFWINSYKHRKPLWRNLDGMVLFGLPFERMALVRVWVEADTGKRPGFDAFTIHGLTPIVRDHLTPARRELLGLPTRTRGELITAIDAHRNEMAQCSPPDSVLVSIVLNDPIFAQIRSGQA